MKKKFIYDPKLGEKTMSFQKNNCLIHARAALKAYGYDERAVMRFLNGLELNSGTSLHSIIKMGLKNL
jgi:Holliday junction resolvasome RuvABC DNA-binding subunit